MLPLLLLNEWVQIRAREPTSTTSEPGCGRCFWRFPLRIHSVGLELLFNFGLSYIRCDSGLLVDPGRVSATRSDLCWTQRSTAP